MNDDNASELARLRRALEEVLFATEEGSPMNSRAWIRRVAQDALRQHSNRQTRPT